MRTSKPRSSTQTAPCWSITGLLGVAPAKWSRRSLSNWPGEYGDKLTIAKINIDDNPETPKKYGVRGIPTLTVFKNGNVEATKVGALSKSQLTAFLDSTL